MGKTDHSSIRKAKTHRTISGYPSKDIKISLQRVCFFTIIAIVFLTVIGFWTHNAIKLSLKEIYTDYFQTLLDADITALTIWMENEKSHARYWADEPNLRENIQILAEIARKAPLAPERLKISPALLELQNSFKTIVKDKDYQGFGIIDRNGLILASSKKDAYVGRYIAPDYMNLLKRVFKGETIIEKPHLKSALIPDIENQTDQPIMMTAAPIRDDTGAAIAVLVFTINPDQDFTRILSVARAGASGDTYAFDANGFLLSDSRFEDQLKEIGIIDATPEARSILSVQIRDPGGDLTKGFARAKSLTDRPLTKMARAAIAGHSGVDLEGYRDYRGVEVLGAWRWLPDYGFGIATEISRTEVRAILRPLTIIFWGLVILLVASVGLTVTASFIIQRLRKRIAQVKKLGQYTLEEKIGEGGMGKVYKASHAILKRPTAVKFLKPEAVNPDTITRFEREVQLTSQLTHPNTIEIYDYGHTPEGIFYYAMEYLPGINLAQLIELEGSISPGRVIHILKHICFSLEEAHAIGLVHRDIKPLNVILCERGGQFDAVKLLDFGLVKDIRAHDIEHTATHEMTGTPAYVAPERLTDSQNIDTRSDLYSLGSVGYNLLTAQDVFDGANAMEICYHVMKTQAPRVSERVSTDIPAKLDSLINDCLAKDPAVRPQNASEVINVLNAIAVVTPWEQNDAKRWWAQNNERIQQVRGKAV
ncbi:MAG: serine/threonine protein kinase [Desulfobacterales bacterium]|nr:serine/threonine protein kinase [Desulfobacterales bacterium]